MHNLMNIFNLVTGCEFGLLVVFVGLISAETQHLHQTTLGPNIESRPQPEVNFN